VNVAVEVVLLSVNGAFVALCVAALRDLARRRRE